MMYCSHTYTGELGETTFSKYTRDITVNNLEDSSQYLCQTSSVQVAEPCYSRH